MNEILSAVPAILLLFGLEIVLSVDNVIVITILVSHLPDKIRKRARTQGLILALILRLIILSLVSYLTHLKSPLWNGGLSIRDIIFLLGGIFLFWKAVQEIYGTVEHKETGADFSKFNAAGYAKILGEIVFLDFIFSFDSVITAVALVDHLWIMFVAVIMSYTVILFYANPVGEFIISRPGLKILALAFLVLIGVSIIADGLGYHIPKVYLYTSMGFALAVELLQMRYEHKKRLNREAAPLNQPDKN